MIRQIIVKLSLKKGKKMYKNNGYIYVVYKGTEGNYHCERFPIIYNNSKSVYYKMNGSEELERINRSYLYSKETIEKLFGQYIVPKKFMSLEPFAKEELEEYSERMKGIEKEEKRIYLQREYFDTKIKMTETAEKYKKLFNEDIEDVTNETEEFWKSFKKYKKYKE